MSQARWIYIYIYICIYVNHSNWTLWCLIQAVSANYTHPSYIIPYIQFIDAHKMVLYHMECTYNYILYHCKHKIYTLQLFILLLDIWNTTQCCTYLCYCQYCILIGLGMFGGNQWHYITELNWLECQFISYYYNSHETVYN